jgi:Transglycosylase SLT domain
VTKRATATGSIRKTRKLRKSRPSKSKISNKIQFLRRFARFRRVPAALQIVAGMLLVAVLIPSVNWIYQVIRKPSELFFPVSDRLFKTPTETWQAYSPIFRAHATSIMTPDLLAALAQVEASGNPVARTYWRWSHSRAPFKIYQPASSAVGMYQITDGTFEEARQYCIHDHRVVKDGRWNEPRTCWFNSLYMRVVPSHAVELTASNLDRRVRETLRRHGMARTSLRQQQDLAIITHLCGAGAGSAFARRGLHLRPGQRCGDHDVRRYLARVHAMARVFARMPADD